MRKLAKASVAFLLAVASVSAMAHGRVHFGINIGPYWGPWWVVPPPVYYPTPVVIEREEPIVIEQTTPPVNYWYFCRPTATYYPYVKSCAEPWERVPAKPDAQ